MSAPSPATVPDVDDAGAAVVWHASGPDAVGARLGSGRHGLGSEEAARRLAVHGPNVLAEGSPPSAVAVLARQFRSPLIYVLLLAMGVTLALGEHIDAGVIGAVLALNALIGFAQERKAEGAVRALTRLVVPRARVLRDGQEWEVDSRDLVPGDVVLLEPGARVPADLRLVTTTMLRIDESLLTGESLPVAKGTDPVPEGAALADRACMGYTGSIVTSGRGAGIVVGTGSGTELGAIAGLIRRERGARSPLQVRMDRFAKVIGAAVAAASVTTFVTGVALGEGPGDMFLVAVALAVAAVPEGLPVAVTITLAVGVSRMARRNAIVRRLAAVETLGSTTVIGSDKTGTLTMNRMTVREVWTAGGRTALDGDLPAAGAGSALHRTLLAGVLTNEAEVYRTAEGLGTVGDPTEVALLLAAIRLGIEPDEERAARDVFAEIPFEPSRRYSASVRVEDGRHVVYVKGAPERVVEMCDTVLTESGPVPIEPDVVLEATGALAQEGLRVLAFASRTVPPTPARGAEVLVEEPRGLVLLGLQGMLDPPREGVRDSVAACQEAGIRVVMITGDHGATARAVALSLGIDVSGGVLTGADLQSLDDDGLARRVSDVSLYVRVSPEHKLRIVKALQARGDVVAVTGDGVNDAPALKAAEIGVAMGRDGTDVAREAADMVLADDAFVSIAAAVEEGRVTFDNIRKVTFFLVSTGAAEVAAIVVAVWLRWPLVMLPAQLLWLNLVTNGLQDVALAFEPGEKGVLRRRPRPPREGIFSPLLWERTVLAGVVMAAGTLVTFRWALDSTGSVATAQTVALTTMVVFEVFQAGNARSERVSLFRMSPFSNAFLFAATAAAVGVHVAALYLPPTQYVLRVEPIGLDAWMRLAAVATSILVAMELHKLVRRRSLG